MVDSKRGRRGGPRTYRGLSVAPGNAAAFFLKQEIYSVGKNNMREKPWHTIRFTDAPNGGIAIEMTSRHAGDLAFSNAFQAAINVMATLRREPEKLGLGKLVRQKDNQLVRWKPTNLIIKKRKTQHGKTKAK